MKNRDYSINSCRICPSIGSILAFKGIERCFPLVHGSQGCATYIRRYMISHFREPVDVASSSFSEENAIFGGEEQLKKAIFNLCFQHNPLVIGITSSCLVETLGEDVEGTIKKILSIKKELPYILYVSNPPYRVTYDEAFSNTLLKVTEILTRKDNISQDINIIFSPISSADIRALKDFCGNFSEKIMFFPDYSDTLDSGHNGNYQFIPQGGTPLEQIKAMAMSNATIEIGFQNKSYTAAYFLKEAYNVPLFSLPLPCGVKLTDLFVEKLELVSGKKVSQKIMSQRARLIDAYIDGHKYTYGKKVAIIGEPSFVTAIASFAIEIGMTLKLIASGSSEQSLKKHLQAANVTVSSECIILGNSDFEEILLNGDDIDLIIGNSKCYRFSKKINAPLIRCTFPIHDRFGAERIRFLLYDGTLSLLDRCINALLSKKQIIDGRDYSYM